MIDIGKIIESVRARLKEALAIPFPKHDPERLLVACVDARMPIASYGFGPGTTLIKRKIAALVPKPEDDLSADMAATLEFAIKAKKVKEIVVLGHTDCGGVDACLHGGNNLPAVQKYLRPLHAVRDGVMEAGGDSHEQARALEIAAVLESLENLKKYQCVQDAGEAVKVEGRLHDVRNNHVYRIVENENGIDLQYMFKAAAPSPVGHMSVQDGSRHERG